jgi:hypothetical protein
VAGSACSQPLLHDICYPHVRHLLSKQWPCYAAAACFAIACGSALVEACSEDCACISQTRCLHLTLMGTVQGLATARSRKLSTVLLDCNETQRSGQSSDWRAAKGMHLECWQTMLGACFNSGGVAWAQVQTVLAGRNPESPHFSSAGPSALVTSFWADATARYCQGRGCS